MIKVAVIGASGYAGSELCRLLQNHDQVEIVAIADKDEAVGQTLVDIYQAFYEEYSDTFVAGDEAIDRADVVFAAVPHGVSEKYARKTYNRGKIFIDFGADFRLTNEADYTHWYGQTFSEPSLHTAAVYGLPEMNRAEIAQTRLIANPGCYPTATALALYPALAEGLIEKAPLIVDAKSGVTGAGAALTRGSHYAEVNEGFHTYKAACHRHQPEIEQTLARMAGEPVPVTFVPHLLPVNRGILATIYAKKTASLAALHTAYRQFYAAEPFVKVLPLGSDVDIKHVRLTNCCHLALAADERSDTLIITSAIDNMVKGAAGQAVQNMNIACGLPETTGLPRIAPSF